MIALSHFIEDALAREQDFLLEAVQDLTPEELVWRATPAANPIGWMLWHMLRVEERRNLVSGCALPRTQHPSRPTL